MHQSVGHNVLDALLDVGENGQCGDNHVPITFAGYPQPNRQHNFQIRRSVLMEDPAIIHAVRSNSQSDQHKFKANIRLRLEVEERNEGIYCSSNEESQYDIETLESSETQTTTITTISHCDEENVKEELDETIEVSYSELNVTTAREADIITNEPYYMTEEESVAESMCDIGYPEKQEDTDNKEQDEYGYRELESYGNSGTMPMSSTPVDLTEEPQMTEPMTSEAVSLTNIITYTKTAIESPKLLITEPKRETKEVLFKKPGNIEDEVWSQATDSTAVPFQYHFFDDTQISTSSHTDLGSEKIEGNSEMEDSSYQVKSDPNLLDLYDLADQCREELNIPTGSNNETTCVQMKEERQVNESKSTSTNVISNTTETIITEPWTEDENDGTFHTASCGRMLFERWDHQSANEFVRLLLSFHNGKLPIWTSRVVSAIPCYHKKEF